MEMLKLGHHTVIDRRDHADINERRRAQIIWQKTGNLGTEIAKSEGYAGDGHGLG